MKYKLIKEFPGSPKLRHIVTGGNGFSYRDRGFEGKLALHETWKSFSEKEVESSPEFFTPYVFTTLDNKDIFVGDTFYFIDSSNKFYLSGTATIHCGIRNLSGLSGKVFSTKEAAQNHIDELNKPKFEKGEWLYFDSGLSKTLFRFLRIEGNKYKTTEGYQTMASGSVHIHGEHTNIWSTKENVTKATPSEIESILSKVAIHKGFKEGVKFTSAMSGHQYNISEYVEFRYQNHCDALNEGWGNCVYYQGKWAKIVEDVLEYVEVLKDSYPLVKGDICKVVDGIVESHRYENKNGYLKYQYPDERLFKSSTKEAYDAQFKTKELTITLDGDVVNTSHWGSSVKITYK